MKHLDTSPSLAPAAPVRLRLRAVCLWRALLLMFGLIALAGCGMIRIPLFRSPPKAPFAARVVPIHTGIDMEPRAEVLRLVYVWHVHDYDGKNHTLTWVVSKGKETEGLASFNQCLRAKTVAKKSADRPLLAQAVRACAKSALNGYFEASEPGETEYKVVIVTAATAKFMTASAGSAPASLGAQMRVKSREPADMRIFSDVQSCLNTAQGGRSYENCGSQIWQCSAVRPMLHSFGDCLRSRSYSVEAE